MQLNFAKEGKDKKKERGGKRRRREKSDHGCTLSFYNGYFAVFGRKKKGRGPFGGNVLKTPAKCTSATAFCIVCAKMVARVRHYDEKRFKLQDDKDSKKHRKRFGEKTFVIKSLYNLQEKKHPKSSNSEDICHCFANCQHSTPK